MPSSYRTYSKQIELFKLKSNIKLHNIRTGIMKHIMYYKNVFVVIKKFKMYLCLIFPSPPGCNKQKAFFAIIFKQKYAQGKNKKKCLNAF